MKPDDEESKMKPDGEESIKAIAKSIANVLKNEIIDVMATGSENRNYMRCAAGRDLKLCELLGAVSESTFIRVCSGSPYEDDPGVVYDERVDMGESFVNALKPYANCRVAKIFMRCIQFNDVLDIFISGDTEE